MYTKPQEKGIAHFIFQWEFEVCSSTMLSIKNTHCTVDIQGGFNLLSILYYTLMLLSFCSKKYNSSCMCMGSKADLIHVSEQIFHVKF